MDKIIKTEKESFNVNMGKLNSNILLISMQNCAVIWKTIWWFLIKLNIHLICNLSIPRHMPKIKIKMCPHKDMHTNVHSSFIYNSQKLEKLVIIQMSIKK